MDFAGNTGDDAYRKAVADIASGLAHEVRNPLAIVKANIDVLESDLKAGAREGSADDAARRYKMMRRELDRINAIMTGFIEFSKAGSSVMGTYEPEEGLRRVVEGFSQSFGNISFSFDSKEPGAALFGDKSRIEGLLANLLKNAVEAIGEGGEAQGRVDVRLYTSGSRLILEVTDNGAGIDGNNADKLFLPFYTTKSDGTGLGLHVCQQTAREHGGALQITANANGKGATASLTLPVVSD